MHNGYDHLEAAEDATLNERVASLEVEVRNTKTHDDEVRAALVKLSDSVSSLASATSVNAALLQQIQSEIGEVRKKADFIPNTLVAALVATAITFGITSLSSKANSQIVVSAEAHEAPTTELGNVTDDKENSHGNGNN